MVTTGLITVFIWDTLVFDKRDAMVLGPLPLRGTTIVAAKLAALATLLLGTALAVNLTSGLPFAFVTGGPEGHVLRHLGGHLAGTIGGAVFMFSALIIVRGMLVLACSPQFAATAGSFMQFTFMSAVLCFMMVPTAMGDTRPVFLGPEADGWMPMAWFFGLFETLRGSRHPGVDVLAQRALIALPIAVVGAIARDVRRLLEPDARGPRTVGAGVRQARGFGAAWRALFTGRDLIARGTSDFILTTLARSRPQQVPIAICARDCGWDYQRVGFDASWQPCGAAKPAHGCVVDSPRHRLLDHRRPALVVLHADGASCSVGVPCSCTSAIYVVLVGCSRFDRSRSLSFRHWPPTRSSCFRCLDGRSRRGTRSLSASLSSIAGAMRVASPSTACPLHGRIRPGIRSSKRAGRSISVECMRSRIGLFDGNFKRVTTPHRCWNWLLRGLSALASLK